MEGLNWFFASSSMVSAVVERTMDKEDAKYLIDQFNKYASWSMIQHYQLSLTLDPLLVSVLALFVSSGFVLFPDLSRSSIYARIGFIAFLIVVFLFVQRRAIRKFNEASLEQDENETVLQLLMDFYLRHKSLPDNLTFEQVVSGKPAELKILLQCESDRNPHTPLHSPAM